MKKYLHLLIINMFFIQKPVNNNLFKNNHIIILWNVLQVIGFQNSSGVFEWFDWLRLGKFCRHQSTRAYFKGGAYIKIVVFFVKYSTNTNGTEEQVAIK